MSSAHPDDHNPYSENHYFSTILEASDINPWPLIIPIPENMEDHNSSWVLDLNPNLVQRTSHAQENSSSASAFVLDEVSEIGKDLLENSFDYQKDDSFSTCTLEDLANPWSILQEGSSRLPIEGIRSTGDLDSTSVFHEQENSASRLYDEHDSSTLIEKRNLEPTLEPNIYEGSLQSRTSCPKNSSTSCAARVDDKDDEPRSGKGLTAKAKRPSAKPNARERKYRFKALQNEKNANQLSNNEGEGSSAKKEDHNAKERVRRMKLNATYLALGALLPDHSRRSKKRWSAPFIIDRTLEYIPQLENEIEKLTLRKNNIVSSSSSSSSKENNKQRPNQEPTVSVHEVRQGEVIIQICTQNNRDDAFANLLQNVEAKGMCIMGASTLQICDERICYNLHLQMEGSWSDVPSYLTILKEKVMSWLS